MTKQQERERVEFAGKMSREFPDFTLAEVTEFAEELMRLARRHGKLAERECNGHQTWDGNWDEAAAKRDELAGERLEARITKLCERMGCGVKFGGDPRGYTVLLILPSGRGNTWGGDEHGWGVPQ